MFSKIETIRDMQLRQMNLLVAIVIKKIIQVGEKIGTNLMKSNLILSSPTGQHQAGDGLPRSQGEGGGATDCEHRLDPVHQGQDNLEVKNANPPTHLAVTHNFVRWENF